jgi:glycosyltransferase involved in cell wall biosynthesis
VLVGDGAETVKQHLKKLTATLGLEAHVIFAGFRRDVPQALAAMTCVVLPSSSPEASPGAVLEAQAMGKPIIATRVGGLPEIVQDRETGLLVDPGDAKGLAEAILWVLDHPREAREMGWRGREHVVKHWSLEATVDRTDKVYRELL